MPGPLSATVMRIMSAAAVEAAGHAYPARRGLVLQRLLRVDDQVEQHLMELVGVGEDRRNVLARSSATSMLLVRIA